MTAVVSVRFNGEQLGMGFVQLSAPFIVPISTLGGLSLPLSAGMPLFLSLGISLLELSYPLSWETVLCSAGPQLPANLSVDLSEAENTKFPGTSLC